MKSGWPVPPAHFYLPPTHPIKSAESLFLLGNSIFSHLMPTNLLILSISIGCVLLVYAVHACLACLACLMVMVMVMVFLHCMLRCMHASIAVRHHTSHNQPHRVWILWKSMKSMKSVDAKLTRIGQSIPYISTGYTVYLWIHGYISITGPNHNATLQSLALQSANGANGANGNILYLPLWVISFPSCSPADAMIVYRCRVQSNQWDQRLWPGLAWSGHCV